MSTEDKTIEGIVTINMPCQYGFLRIARQSVMDFCNRAGLTEYKASQLEMAVDEACANIIEHSYGGEVTFDDTTASHPGLQMNLIHRGNAIVVEIHDFGRGFDHADLDEVSPEQYLENHRERGLGMYIIQNFVDDMEYVRGDGKDRGNCLRPVKKA